MDADDLYALAPEDFTAARDDAARRARAAGDRPGAQALAALRRPSASAWLVNRLARERGPLLEQVLALGPALAQAQGDRDAAVLRSLGEQRRELVEAVTAAAVEVSGRSVSRAVRDEVAGTLEAALADPASAQAVRSGRLVRSLSYAGFGEVDLADAVAPAPPAPRAAGRRPAPRDLGHERAERLAAAEQAALSAAGRLDDAVRASQRAERDLQAAVDAEAEAAAAVEAAREALDRAEQVRQDVAHARAEVERTTGEAAAAVDTAQQEAETARDELDRLRRRA